MRISGAGPRALFAGSLVLLIIAFTQPVLATEHAPSTATMCVKVPVGTTELDVNGASTSFSWSDEGVTWSASGADPSHFRVHFRSDAGMETIYGASGSWTGTGLRGVKACHCPQHSTTTTSKVTTTTKVAPTKVTTTTKVAPTKATTTTKVAPTTKATTTTTVAPTKATTTTTVAPTTKATTTTTVAPTTKATTTTTTKVAPTSQVTSTTKAPETTTKPTIGVKPRQVERPSGDLPLTGLPVAGMALTGSALLGLGGLMLTYRSRRTS